MRPKRYDASGLDRLCRHQVYAVAHGAAIMYARMPGEIHQLIGDLQSIYGLGMGTGGE